MDCSTTCFGWAIFDDEKLIAYGKIIPDDKCKDVKDYNERINNLVAQLHFTMKQYMPKEIYMEDVPRMNKGGVQTAIVLGCVHGAVSILALLHHLPIHFIQVGEWRHKIGLATGNKEDMKRDNLKRLSIERTNTLFSLSLKYVSPSSKLNEDDAADAILIGASNFDKYCAKYTKFGYLKE